jgi:peptidoglycan/LPS O-acetylase OafA/YrhL
VLNFFALFVIVIRFGPWLARRVRFRRLEALGQASLPVFCAQIVAVLVVLSAIGDKKGEMPLWFDTALLAAVLIGLYGVALFSNRLDREQRLAVAPARLTEPAGG